MKKAICEAFCEEISVREVPVGLAVSTGFRRADGDAVGFYVIPDKLRPGHAHLEDDGTTIPYLEACGVDFDTQTRATALQELLREYDAEFDEDEAVIRSRVISDDALPRAAIRFVALLLRFSDFLLLKREYVESAFREDATSRIKDLIGSRASIQESEPVSVQLKEVKPDLVLRAKDRIPVAVFLVTSSQRVNDAIFLQMTAHYEARQPIAVIALLESEKSVSRELRQRAANRLTTVPVYTGDEQAAIQRIQREVLGETSTRH